MKGLEKTLEMFRRKKIISEAVLVVLVSALALTCSCSDLGRALVLVLRPGTCFRARAHGALTF